MKSFKPTRKISLTALLFLLMIYLTMGYFVSQSMFFIPEVERIDLLPILTNHTLNEEDYETLYYQTGLGPTIIDELLLEPDGISDILRFQENYFKSQNVVKTNMNWLTREDAFFDDDGNQIGSFELAPYQNGDIFLSKSTYTVNWRHGHAGIVVDEVHGLVLESLEPGTSSMLQNANKWTYYPTFKMMRLKDTPKALRDEIAYYALTHLQGIPYNILAMKTDGSVPRSTQCSHLVWQAYKAFDIDIDSNKGIFVSPGNIAKSPLLETLQIIGINPSKGW